ncbi:MAG: 2-oxo acid dehydrogenase subunit E2 [Gemmatimonadaceae bacterium]|nr:2-oxo acid dehydrogenase subunit E2 [Gemmatimonadaceae bacterium]
MPNLIDVTVPVGQSEGTESMVSTWFKSVGDQVTENEPLLEIATDKVNMEVAAPGTGRLAEILKRDGEQVEPGEVLGRIETGAAAVGSGELSPAVRKLLRENNLDASQISGTGRGGRITHQDVMDFVASRGSGKRVPHTQMRRSIAQHMVQSVATAPHVTSVFEADLSSVIADREARKGDFESRGVKLTYTAYFVRAAVKALKAVPEVNSRWHDDALEIFDDINIGIATALGSGGLIVPVITRAQDLDLAEIAERLQDLTERARSERLDARDVQNGTFTISNHGVSGSLVATPVIINQPQSAILGVGKLERRAKPAGDSGNEVTVRPMCYVSLTIDHRVLDGFQANQFLTAWVEAVETVRAPESHE